MSTNLLIDKLHCFGCTACAGVCPKQAIAMQEDEEGFLYPNIDESLCIKCGLCNKVCPAEEPFSISSGYPKAFGVKNKNEDIRMRSTSGGVFSEISRTVMEKGGIVYGAAFDECMNVVHRRVTSWQDLGKLRGSKYVQSDLRGVFSSVSADLKQGVWVLFSGTPCQCDGLRSFLNIKKCDTSRLVLCDIVCHGVPSPLIWREYVKTITKKEKLTDFLFRDKKYGWHGANITVTYEEGKVKSNSALLRSFTTLYSLGYISRHSCSTCQYANVDRRSDITIADFWGIEKIKPEFDDQKGVSLVLINSPKGETLFNEIQQRLHLFSCDLEHCKQKHLQRPQEESPLREMFWTEYREKGIEYVLKHRGGNNLKGKMRRLASVLKKKIRSICTK